MVPRIENLAQSPHSTDRLAEAEPLMRRALAIDEARLGPNDPDVAIRLSNLASPLKGANRLRDTEQLMRRVSAIDDAAVRASIADAHRQAGLPISEP